MARIRDPARDKAKELYLKNKSITNREIANMLQVDEKKIATWKYRDNWESTSKKNKCSTTKKECSTTTTKKLIQQAKAMVINGSTIDEASAKTGLNSSTIRNYSASENWMERQEKFMQKVYSKVQNELGEKHIQERIITIKMLEQLKEKTFKDILQGVYDNLRYYNLAIKNIGEATELETKFLGIPDMKMYIRKDTDTNENTQEEKTLRIEVID